MCVLTSGPQQHDSLNTSGVVEGSLHTYELLDAVVAGDTGLRTVRRISPAFLMDVPRYHKVLVVTDAAINIAPTLEEKADICRTRSILQSRWMCIDLVAVREPRVSGEDCGAIAGAGEYRWELRRFRP